MAEGILVTERQYNIVKTLIERGGSSNIADIANRLGLKPEDLMRDLAELEAKDLVRVKRVVSEKPVLTSEGTKALERGFPEEIVYRVISRCINLGVAEFISCIAREAGVSSEDARIGFQYLVKSRCLHVEGGIVKPGAEEKCGNVAKEAERLRQALSKVKKGGSIDPDVARVLRRRKMITIEKRSIIVVEVTKQGLSLWRQGKIRKARLVTIVTPSIAREGSLENVIVKEFDLSVTPPRAGISRANAYIEFLDLVREILEAMGFEEVKGPHVELEFWNFDALFQAQDHPAREIHDTFFLNTSFRGKVPEELLKRASIVHERGWRYRWSTDKALTPVLRTQTTAVSARIIYERGAGEYRCFTIDRVFRPETLDAKHAMEFYQLDGVIVGRNVSFRDLLAFFREFSAAIGIREIWFKPGYFPFTEPSVEGFIKHPKLGWIEVFPGGVFRPEVMEILGAKNVRAIAWGIGIDRLAMAVLGIEDIRDLFSRDIDFIERLKVPMLPYFLRKTSGKEVKIVKTPV